MIKRVLVFGFLIAFVSAFSQPITGYKVKRDHNGDTIVGYLAENIGNGNTGVVFLNAGDTSKIYSDGDFVVIDPATGVKVKSLTYRNSREFVSIYNDRLYVTSIDSMHPQADTFYISYCDGCSGVSGEIGSGDTIFVDTSSITPISDTIYVVFGTEDSPTGWYGLGDTIYIDTTEADIYWELNGENITPSDWRSIEVSDSLLFDSYYIINKTDILSDVLDNNSFETNSGYIDPPPGFILFGFTGWSGGANVDSSHNAKTGSLSAEITSGNLTQSKTLTSGTGYTIKLYSIGAGRISLCRNTTVCYNFSTGSWVTSTSYLSTYYTVPSSSDWQEVIFDVTPNSTVSHTLRLDGVGTSWIVDDVYIGLRDDYLEVGSDDIRIKTLPAGTSDTSVVVENRRLYKRVIPSGSIDTFFVAYSQVQDGGWKYSGDTLYIDTTRTEINYDTLASYINVDSIITSTVIDSLLATINIDSLVTVNVENYLDTNTTFIDTFYVAYGAFPSLLSGWRYSGDTIYVDTTIYSDTVTFQFVEVDSIFVTQITVDTILLGSDTIYSITQLQDSLYFNFTSNPSVSAWVGMGDTVSIDTAAMYIWTVGDSGTQNAKFKNSQNYVTGNYGIAIGYQDTMTGSYSFASGWKTVSEGQGSTTVGVLTKASGNGSFAGGFGAQTGVKYYVTASGVASFNYSSVTATNTSDASGQASAVLGGTNNNASGDNTVVLGGVGQSGTKDNTVYVPDVWVSDTAFIGGGTEYVTDYAGGLAIGSDAGHYVIVDDTVRLAIGAGVVAPNPSGAVRLGGSTTRFSSLWLSDTAYTNGLVVDIPSAATGRVAASQDADGTIEFIPVSELTGTADTFYLAYGDPQYGWKMSGDTIHVDTSHWVKGDHVIYPKSTRDSVSIGTTNKYAPLYIHGDSVNTTGISIYDDTLIKFGYADLWQYNVDGYIVNEEGWVKYGGENLVSVESPVSVSLLAGSDNLQLNGTHLTPSSGLNLGQSAYEWNNAYFDGIVRTDGLQIDSLVSGTGDFLVLDGTTVKKTTAAFDTSLWDITGSVIYPKSTSYDVAIGKVTASYDLDVNGSARTGGVHYFNNANNKIQYDGVSGLAIYGYPSLINFYLNNSSFIKMNKTGAQYFIPSTTNTVDLGLITNRWANLWIGTDADITGRLCVGQLSSVTGTQSSAIGIGANASGDYSISLGSSYASGDYSFSWGGSSESAGVSSIAFGYSAYAGGGNYNSVFGGMSDTITSSGNGNIILGGSFNKISGSADNTVIIGGVSIAATEDSSVYVPKLRVHSTATDYTIIDSNGITLAGTHILWDDIRVSANDVKVTGVANVPDWAQFADNGSGSVGVYTYLFSPTTMEQVFFSVQMPHSFNGGTVYPHVHWSPTNATTGDTVVWALEYTWANITGTFGNTTTITCKGVTTGDGKHILTGFPSIDGSSFSESSMLICRLYRDAATTPDDYAADAALLEFDIHFPVSQLGGSDNPTPDY